MKAVEPNWKRYKKTMNGVIATLYTRMAYRDRSDRGLTLPFSPQQFHEWFMERVGDKYDKWVEAGYTKALKPSVDRIDPLKGYTFDNMQLITTEENLNKGILERPLLRGRRVMQKTMDGKLVATFMSLKEAGKAIGLKIHYNIGRCARGESLSCKGFLWEYVDDDTTARRKKHVLEATKTHKDKNGQMHCRKARKGLMGLNLSRTWDKVNCKACLNRKPLSQKYISKDKE